MKKWFSKESKKDFYLLYTLAFAGISLFLYSYFYLNGKSMVWSHDGVPQHLNSLAYYGRYLREILGTLIRDHRLSIPMWDMHIGYGSDILTPLHYYVIGDPLALLSVFVPAEKTEILYQVLIFLRIYLAGISFSLYCFYHKNPKQAVFLGTLIYIFAGWTIYASMKHPYFSNPMIYLPLILIGIDKIYKKEKPHVFIWATAIAAMSNFYFFYMICIFMFLYAAFRYFAMFQKRSFRDVFRWFLRFVGYYGVALMIAAIIFLPVIMTLFGTDRFQAENYVPLLYDRIYYEKYLGCLIGENMIQWGVAGYSAVSMAGVFVLFSRKKKYRELKAGFLLLNLFLLLPFAGHVLNGFSYVSNRWIWAYGMLIAYIFVKAYPELYTLTVREKRRIFVMLIVYTALALGSEAARTQRNMAAVILLVLSVFTVVSFGNVFVQGKYLCAITAGLLIVSIMSNVSYQYSYEKDYLSEFSGSGEALEKLESGADKAVLAAGDEGVYRYDQYGSLPYGNTSMQMGTNSTAYYFSVANGNISRFFDEMYLNTPWEQHYENLDGRTILDRLAAVKYFVMHDDGYGYLPYGYNKEKGSVKKGSKKYRAYENENSLPLGYTYDSWIPREDYEKMTVTQKQQALLQGVVLEESSLPETKAEFDDQEMDYRIQPGEGCSVRDGKIIVSEAGAEVKIIFRGLEDSETYLIAEGLDYDGLSPRELVDEQEWEKMSVYDKNSLLYEDSQWRYWKESKEASFQVYSELSDKKIKIFTNKYNAYSGKHDFLCNLGYWKTGRRTLTLTFDNTGVYSFDSLKVVCQPMGSVESKTSRLGKESLKDISISTNKISGNITVSEDKMLVMALPYSSGFRAFVDGTETELYQANTMYMALEVPKGTHNIQFTYCTPYLRAGGVITVLGIGIYVIICLVIKRKRSK
ncbi:MAG: YfhO family protein [Eubacteriales bacterium]|nr:YfhO family protein [Eubacteriales bacterium]